LISWPAILHYPGQDELEYIASANAWENDQQLHTLSFQTAGRLIDSHGRVFNLPDMEYQPGGNGFAPSPSQEAATETTTLEEVIELVRAHAAQSASCCIAKISAPSIAAAIQLVDTI